MRFFALGIINVIGSEAGWFLDSWSRFKGASLTEDHVNFAISNAGGMTQEQNND
jgi:hypothetical protein